MRFQIWLKEMFSFQICLLLMRNSDKSAAAQMSTLFGTREQVDSGRMFENKSFRAFKSRHFSDSITSQKFKLGTWSFFWKSEKVRVESTNWIKIREKVSDFWGNGLWTCCAKFSQFWWEYMWSEVNVLTNSTEISDLTERDVSYLTFSFANEKIG